MNLEVPKIATPIGDLELAAVLRDAYSNVFGKEPQKALACAWAQCVLEHGHGKHVYCHNLGNIMAGSKWAGNYYLLKASERIDKAKNIWKVFESKFRAHMDFIDGARNYWKLLKNQYASALALMEVGDAHGAAMRLGALNYYTAHEEIYSATMASLHASYHKHIAPKL